jgi:hypothetical protein
VSTFRIKLVEEHRLRNKPGREQKLLRTVCVFESVEGQAWTQEPAPLGSRATEAVDRLSYSDTDELPDVLSAAGAAAEGVQKNIFNRSASAGRLIVESPNGGKLLILPGLTLRWEKATAAFDRIAQVLSDGQTATLTIDELRRYTGS